MGEPSVGHIKKSLGYIHLKYKNDVRTTDKRRIQGQKKSRQTIYPTSSLAVFSIDEGGKNEFIIFKYLLASNNHKAMDTAELKKIQTKNK